MSNQVPPAAVLDPVGRTMRPAADEDALRYRSISPLRLWQHGEPPAARNLFTAWIASLIASIALGLTATTHPWTGIPIEFGGIEVYLSLYPPLLICLSWALLFGWLWGAIPAYLTTLTLALYADVPLAWATLFACSDPLAFAVLAIGYRAIPARRDLRDPSALIFYVQLAFIASIFGSSGALIWSFAKELDSTAMLALWQGWWMGSFLQSVVIVAPLIYLCWPPIERWMRNNPDTLRSALVQPRHYALRLLAAITCGMLFYGFITFRLSSDPLHAALDTNRSSEEIRAASVVMLETSWAFYWIFALIIVFIAFFGYQLYRHWQKSNDLLLDKLREANLQLQVLANTDALTGLHNRRAIEASLHAEWLRSSRLQHGAAVIMLDIDHFKNINDRFGHPVGDCVIRSLGELISTSKRDIDIAGRYGGEEFLILLPETDLAGAASFAERLRERVAAQEVAHQGGTLNFSISLGVALFDKLDGDPETWLRRADQALYRAKRAGRNRMIIDRNPVRQAP